VSEHSRQTHVNAARADPECDAFERFGHFHNDQHGDQPVGSVIYDSVIVGTSPVSLLEAIHVAEKGKRVWIIERESSLGGAWHVSDCLGLSAVEVIPHLLVADPRRR